jgi:uncharacterized protein YkwD
MPRADHGISSRPGELTSRPLVYRRLNSLAVLLVLSSAFVSADGFGQQKSALDSHAAAIVELTNDFRAQEGLDNVAVDTRLAAAAHYFAEYLAKTGRFSHDADGSVPTDRARKHGYDYCIVSENIALRDVSPKSSPRELAHAVVEDWKKSPGHRKNMLDPEVTDIGAAVARSPKGTYYAVQTFGRPRSRAIKFSVVNRTNVSVRYRLGDQSHTVAPRQTRVHSQCRMEELKVELPGAKQETTVKPADKQRLVIAGSESGEYSLSSQ